jgi:hypothetical protein
MIQIESPLAAGIGNNSFLPTSEFTPAYTKYYVTDGTWLISKSTPIESKTNVYSPPNSMLTQIEFKAKKGFPWTKATWLIRQYMAYQEHKPKSVIDFE